MASDTRPARTTDPNGQVSLSGDEGDAAPRLLREARRRRPGRSCRSRSRCGATSSARSSGQFGGSSAGQHRRKSATGIVSGHRTGRRVAAARRRRRERGTSARGGPDDEAHRRHRRRTPTAAALLERRGARAAPPARRRGRTSHRTRPSRPPRSQDRSPVQVSAGSGSRTSGRVRGCQVRQHVVGVADGVRRVARAHQLLGVSRPRRAAVQPAAAARRTRCPSRTGRAAERDHPRTSRRRETATLTPGLSG